MDKKTAIELASRYAEEVKKNLDPDAIILFGSYVNGNPNEWSDIDIAVLMNDFKGDWLETATLLCKITREVSIDIEPHLLDESCDKSGFVRHVIDTGEIIYKVA